MLERIADYPLDLDEAEPPLACDRWIASSLLQKSIRRGNSRLALRAAFRLSDCDRAYLWRRLLIIGFEDVGAADPDALIETVAIATSPKWRSRRGEKASLALVVARLAEAPKDRSADYLISAAATHASLEGTRELCRRVGLESRLRVVEDSSNPLTVRSLGAWFSSGVEGRNGPRIEGGDLGRLSGLLVTLGVSTEFASSMKLAAHRTREPMIVLVPLIWLESQRGQKPTICDDAIPESPMLGGVPMYAFDKHTRLGQTAIQTLVQESASVRACLETYVPKPAWRRAAQMAAFYTDGYLVCRRLDWSRSRFLEALGIESDFGRIGFPSKGIAPLRNVIADALSLLNEIRLRLWTVRSKP